MSEVLSSSAYLGVFISLFSYFLGAMLQKRFRSALLNPILISTALTIGSLLLMRMDYQTYYAGAKWISFLLTPATVCLAIPLYEQLEALKKNYAAILTGILCGVLTSLCCISLLAVLFGLGHAEYVTILPKSITTAIGMPLAESLGGYGSIAAAVIIMTGIAGNIGAEGFLKLVRITHPVAKGVAIGTASHAVGTARAMKMGETEGAISSLSIAVAGLMTVALISVFVNLI